LNRLSQNLSQLIVFTNRHHKPKCMLAVESARPVTGEWQKFVTANDTASQPSPPQPESSAAVSQPAPADHYSINKRSKPNPAEILAVSCAFCWVVLHSNVPYYIFHGAALVALPCSCRWAALFHCLIAVCYLLFYLLCLLMYNKWKKCTSTCWPGDR